jgi:hypothetical protein
LVPRVLAYGCDQRAGARRDTLGMAAARDDANAALASAQQAAKALRDEIERLERAIAAQERIIAYRQSARWWVLLPWMRVRTWLRGTRP